jgi:hypothetical protein
MDGYENAGNCVGLRRDRWVGGDMRALEGVVRCRHGV